MASFLVMFTFTAHPPASPVTHIFAREMTYASILSRPWSVHHARGFKDKKISNTKEKFCDGEY